MYDILSLELDQVLYLDKKVYKRKACKGFMEGQLIMDELKFLKQEEKLCNEMWEQDYQENKGNDLH